MPGERISGPTANRDQVIAECITFNRFFRKTSRSCHGGGLLFAANKLHGTGGALSALDGRPPFLPKHLLADNLGFRS
ncbi:hypothetical protein NP590_18170 [Methylomonas sp. SURF-2]|uniref:Uncharacterized protein n=1 Tax=Methylomonas subterranea TaxID=2952225 RepID=A0ABT1TKN7_9GAMM|nr:hypothetical protein [Methylomonas sp. SURF-2]MCQ8106041.1 hypothetical protein [Methylomonas sp. SURF-2]